MSTQILSREGILGHQINKRIKSFGPCYSQSLLLVDFKENHRYSSLGLKILLKIRQTRKVGSIHEWHFVKWNNEGRKPDKPRL
jgi:hypothetical protein